MMYKIDKKLMSIVRSMQSINDKIDCLVYAKNYYLAKAYLENQKIDIAEYPFIKAFGIKADIQQVKNLANLTTVNYISSVAQVFAQMDRAKQVLEVDKIEDNLLGGGVNVAIGDHACFRQTCAESDRVSFGYTDIEDAIRQLFLHDTHAAAAGHSGCDTNDLLVLFC